MKTNIPVLEIFGPSLQGEGPNVGARCIFVRVQYCDYKCSFCDTKISWADSKVNAPTYAPEDLANYLIDKCDKDKCNHVILTGGNPCLYDFTEVILALNEKNIKVDVETQGSIMPDWLKYIDTIVFSPKGPSSGMPDTYENIINFINDIRHNKMNITIKIPIFNNEDIEFARRYARFINEFHAEYDDSYTRVRLYLSVGNSDVNTTESIRDRVLSDYESLLNQINEDPTDFQNVYILPQLHTLVWGNKSGV